MELCRIFGHVGLHRRYLPDKSVGKCPKRECKAGGRYGYDLEVLGSRNCPHCGTELKHPKTIMINVCDYCGYNKNKVE